MNDEMFNKMISSFLFMYSEFLGMSKTESMEKVISFNSQLEEQIKNYNEKSFQFGQNDHSQQESI